LTAEQQRIHDQELRYSDLFADLALYERKAQSEDAAGRAAMAAGWRGYFAKKSGLTEADAEIVKEIGKEYEQRRDEVNKAYRRAVSEARAEPHTARPSRHNTPAIAEAEDALYGLFPETMAKLVSALGQRSFTRLDSYTIHMHDNSRKSSTHQANLGGPALQASQLPPGKKGLK